MARVKLYATTWALWTMRRAGLVPGIRIRLSLVYRGTRFTCVINDYTGLSMLREIFIDEEYAEPVLPAPRVIFDLDSNIGLSILFFRVRYPEARIYGFEPDPAAFAQLVRNVGKLPGVEVRNVAIGARDERRTLYVSPESWTSSLARSPESKSTTTVMVRSLSSLAEELAIDRIDLLKFDIEGSEWELIAGAHSRRLPDIRAAVGELHAENAPAHSDTLIRGCREFQLELHRTSSRTQMLMAVRRDDARSARSAR